MKRMNNDAVSPVIAVILMVAITVVLAAVLYVMVGGLLTEESGLVTGSGTVETGSKNATAAQINIIKIGGAATSMGEFKAYLTTGTSSVSMDPVAAGTDGQITFVDMNSDGDLTDIDTFYLGSTDAFGTTTPLTPGTDYVFILEKAGSEVFKVSFTTKV